MNPNDIRAQCRTFGAAPALPLALACLLAPATLAQGSLYGVLHGVPSAPGNHATALGDIDNDGDLDAVVGAHSAAGRNRLYLNDGTGVFAELPGAFPVFSAEDFGPYVPTLGDVDNDGNLDVMFAAQWRLVSGVVLGQRNRLLLGNGAGGFTDVTDTNLPRNFDPSHSIAFADIDGDGDLDALVGNREAEYAYYWAPRQNRLLRNDNGVFTDITATHLPQSQDYTNAVAFADIDGDNDPDAIIANTAPNRVRVLRNDAGTFRSVAASEFPTQVHATTIVVGNFDGQGGIDLLTGSRAGPARLFFNAGGGVFTEAAVGHLPPGLDNVESLAATDVDGDGDLDVLVGNASSIYGGSRTVQLLRNDGTGTFADDTASTLPAGFPGGNSIAAGDVDGDGDVDAWVNGPEGLLINLTRQVAYRDTPRIGQPLTLDVYGPPTGAMQLLIAAARARAELPFGTLRLDPLTMLPVAGGMLDANGRSSVSLQVPADPRFLGVSLYWQAAVASPLAMTNLEITTFQ